MTATGFALYLVGTCEDGFLECSSDSDCEYRCAGSIIFVASGCVVAAGLVTPLMMRMIKSPETEDKPVNTAVPLADRDREGERDRERERERQRDRETERDRDIEREREREIERVREREHGREDENL